ncbi:hypothetical protein SASPL_134803 [Salvia splendens]|uniref:Xylulokinase n=1 Tax=Salvia splendens TaxID=180675 RepID=A0A8X8WX07_SALSN|nr:hypothetical protein SASPL_134803 [Salvia splendens]
MDDFSLPQGSFSLGFDSSTQSMKATVLDASLNIVAQEIVNFDSELSHYKTKDGVYRDPSVNGRIVSPTIMWVEALDLILERLHKSGLDFGKIVAVSGSGQQHGSVYWKTGSSRVLSSLDPKKQLADQLGDAFSVKESPIWMDSSTTEQCRAIEKAVGGAMELSSLTGSRAYERFTGPQIRRIFETQPEAYKSTERISLVSSFMASLLIGSYAAIDHTDGAGMNLMDIKERAWSKKILEATAPSLEEKLGKLAPAYDVAGQIASYFVERYHFDKNCLVIQWSGDNPNSLAGLTLNSPGDLAISLGTSDTVFAITNEHKACLEGHVFPNPVDTKGYMVMLCYKNGSLTREEIRNKCADKSWDVFSEYLQRTQPLNGGKLGFYYKDHEIIPPLPVGFHRYVLENFKGDTLDGVKETEVTEFDAASEVRALVEDSASMGAALRAAHGWLCSKKGSFVPISSMYSGKLEKTSLNCQLAVAAGGHDLVSKYGLLMKKRVEIENHLVQKLGRLSLKETVLDQNLKIFATEVVNYDDELPHYKTKGGVHRDPVVDGRIVSPPLMWVEALDLILQKLEKSQFDFGRVVAAWWAIEEVVGGALKLSKLTGSCAHERYAGPQIRKIVETWPDVYENTERVSLVSSFMASFLIGGYACIDHTDEAGMNLIDIKSKSWSKIALEAVAPGLEKKLGDLAPACCCWFLIELFRAKVGNSTIHRLMTLNTPGDLAISLGTSDTVFGIATEHKPSLDGHTFPNPVDTEDYMVMLVYKNGSLTREGTNLISGAYIHEKSMLEVLLISFQATDGKIGFYYKEHEILPPLPIGEHRYVLENINDPLSGIKVFSVAEFDPPSEVGIHPVTLIRLHLLTEKLYIYSYNFPGLSVDRGAVTLHACSCRKNRDAFSSKENNRHRWSICKRVHTELDSFPFWVQCVYSSKARCTELNIEVITLFLADSASLGAALRAAHGWLCNDKGAFVPIRSMYADRLEQTSLNCKLSAQAGDQELVDKYTLMMKKRGEIEKDLVRKLGRV